MNFEEYASSRHALYQRLAEVIETILGHALKECDGIGNRPQTQSRPKETSSLQRKLADRGLLESDMIETKIKDLAGCRIIFYTNADLERFRQSGITNGQSGREIRHQLYEEFGTGKLDRVNLQSMPADVA